MASRNRRINSIKIELLTKSREAMLSAVQIFNNPNVVFKSESFIVLSIISWTYLLHAYYRDKGVEYRYFRQHGKLRRFDKTNRGAFKYWELEKCLNCESSPINSTTKSNLNFLIGLRHEIEHQMTTRIDDYLSARFQACCLNYNYYIKEFFGMEHGIDKHQFSSINEDQIEQLREFTDLPKNIATYINSFDQSVPDDEFNSPSYSYRILYVPKTANRKGQADKVIEFIPASAPEAKDLNKSYVILKDREKPKYLPSKIVAIMKDLGYSKFGITQHTDLWQQLDAKNPNKGYGVTVVKSWYWYENWVELVKQHCEKNKDKYQ